MNCCFTQSIDIIFITELLFLPIRLLVADTKELPKEIEEGITKFNPQSLKHTETVEKNPLPSPEGRTTHNLSPAHFSPFPLKYFEEIV